MALWSGRFTQQTDSLVQKFSESISYDRRLYPFDIQGSQAHAKMLAKQGIISQDDADKIVAGLNDIKKDIDDGNFDFSIALEDIHMNIESRLTERIGQPGARLHTGRSRNDQIATDERLYMRHEADDISLHVKEMQRSLVQLAADWPNLIMPGFTHLQHA
jgi:argininosuccinate lyase